MNPDKPIGRKNYGSIPHLPQSRMGPGDHACHEGQARIATVKKRDRHDTVIVQEKLDGSNVGVARIGDVLYPLGRAGYLASSSPYKQHRLFSDWVYRNYERFMEVLEDGERLVGEWLAQAHSTRYKLNHEPFVAFDLMTKDKRMPFGEFLERLDRRFVVPVLLHEGDAFSIDEAMNLLNNRSGSPYGFHGALEPVEGAVWRVERDKRVSKNNKDGVRVVDFLVKYVRPDKIDGKYLPDISNDVPVWNWQPNSQVMGF